MTTPAVIHHAGKPGARYATKGAKFRSLPIHTVCCPEIPIRRRLAILCHRIREIERSDFFKHGKRK